VEARPVETLPADAGLSRADRLSDPRGLTPLGEELLARSDRRTLAWKLPAVFKMSWAAPPAPASIAPVGAQSSVPRVFCTGLQMHVRQPILAVLRTSARPHA
jgi:hypothetical protein